MQTPVSAAGSNSNAGNDGQSYRKPLLCQLVLPSNLRWTQFFFFFPFIVPFLSVYYVADSDDDEAAQNGDSAASKKRTGSHGGGAVKQAEKGNCRRLRNFNGVIVYIYRAQYWHLLTDRKPLLCQRCCSRTYVGLNSNSFSFFPFSSFSFSFVEEANWWYPRRRCCKTGEERTCSRLEFECRQ